MQFQVVLLGLVSVTAAILVDDKYESPKPNGVDDAGAYHGKDSAHYKFEYGVHDPHSHDVHSQYEKRNGQHATGGYTLEDPDGTHRIVKYASAPHSGFEAVVERVGYALHPAYYGDHTDHGGERKNGATSYVSSVQWGNQGHGEGDGDGKRDDVEQSSHGDGHDVGDGKDDGHGDEDNGEHDEDGAYDEHDEDSGCEKHDNDDEHGEDGKQSADDGTDGDSQGDSKEEDNSDNYNVHLDIEKEYGGLEKWIWGQKI